MSVLARGAEVIPIPPPAFYGVAIGGGVLLQRVRPLDLDLGVVVPVLVVATGAGLTIGGIVGVIRHRTTIVPHHPVSALVTTGAYRLSRNPMYTGLAILVVGVAMLLGTGWPIVLLPAALMAVRTLVIAPEERYLAARFGQGYRDYRQAVRRWL
ncbi:isoprenylcysteine carboxylmethyltransferase family protein [soil metagenome]